MPAFLSLHEKIKQSIKDGLLSGRYRPGEQLPSQRELGQMFSASHMTVRRAIDELVSEGVIFTVPGKGFFINEFKQVAEQGAEISFSEEMTRLGLKVSSRILAARPEPAGPLLAHSLNIAPGALTYLVRRVRMADDQPIAIQQAHLRADLCPNLLHYDLSARSLFDILRTEYGLRIGGGTGIVFASLATTEEVELLNLSQPAALLVTERITLLEDHTPIEFVRSSYRADRYQLQLGY